MAGGPGGGWPRRFGERAWHPVIGPRLRASSEAMPDGPGRRARQVGCARSWYFKPSGARYDPETDAISYRRRCRTIGRWAATRGAAAPRAMGAGCTCREPRHACSSANSWSSAPAPIHKPPALEEGAWSGREDDRRQGRIFLDNHPFLDDNFPTDDSLLLDFFGRGRSLFDWNAVGPGWNAESEHRSGDEQRRKPDHGETSASRDPGVILASFDRSDHAPRTTPITPGTRSGPLRTTRSGNRRDIETRNGR